jgi:DNA repair photolyase
MLPYLETIDRLGYRYYFQFTLTAYDQSLEKNLPAKAERIALFQELAKQIGPDRVLWRFDPIFFTPDCTTAYHLYWFEDLASQLHGFTRRCTISFLSLYEKCKRNMQGVELLHIEEAEKIRFVSQLAVIANTYGMQLCACCDSFLHEQCGVEAARCIDDRVLAAVLGHQVRVKKDSGQRPGCGCVTSIDIGAYNTCGHGCRYCYANVSERVVAQNHASHDPDAPLLAGALTGRETITLRKMRSCRTLQQVLF